MNSSPSAGPTEPRAASLAARLGRHLLLLGAALAVMLLALHGCMSVYQGQRMHAALARIEERWGDLEESAAPPPPAVPDEENAAVLLRRAIAVHELDTSRLPAVNRLKQGRPPEPGDEEDLQAVVDANAEALAALQAALSRPALDWRAAPPPGSHQQADTAPFADLMLLAGTNWTSGMLAARAGDRAGAMAAVSRQLFLARTMEDSTRLLPQVLRVRVASRALDLMRATLDGTSPGSAELEELATGLARMPGSKLLQEAAVAAFKQRTRFYLAILGEGETGGAGGGASAQAGSLDLATVAVERAGRSLRGENPMTPEDLSQVGGAATRWLLRPALRLRMVAYLEDASAMVSALETPAYLRPAGEALPPEAAVAAGGWLDRLLPDLDLDRQLLTLGDLLDARLALARTAVALHRHRAAHGGFPARLEELVPGVLPQLPLDPLTGSPPVYRQQGSGFTLESAAAGLEAEITRDEPWGPTGLLSWSFSR